MCDREWSTRKKRVFPARSGKDKASPSGFAARQVGWKIELALLTEHYAGIRGSARQKRGEKARERERQRERETERAWKGRKSNGTQRVSPRLRVDESGSHPLFRSRSHPVQRVPPPPMASPEFQPFSDLPRRWYLATGFISSRLILI